MRDEVRQLIKALDEEATRKEEFAKELAALAEQYKRNGNHLRAEAMINQSRHQRIRSMQAYAQIAALTTHYSYLLKANT